MALNLPECIIEFVKSIFKQANYEASKALTQHPSLHEPHIDSLLIANLSASPPTYFQKERAAVAIETHWLGSRSMYDRWEIADIALFIIIRRSGTLEKRKVALLQTKRLYSREIPTRELEEFDYHVGIGRIADKPKVIFPLSNQRNFSFDFECVFGAMAAGSPQVGRIDAYQATRGIPVYYGMYCPLAVPYSGLYPATSGEEIDIECEYGMRVESANVIHKALGKVVAGKAPSLAEFHDQEKQQHFGWTLEDFVAEEVMRCNEGKLFEDDTDTNLHGLLYERSAPITAAIAITIDIGAD